MPGFNPDKINIHDLTIEEPEKQTEAPFDPERDVAEEDWKTMEDYRRSYIEREKNEKGNWATLIWALSARQAIIGHKPEMPKELIENIDNERKRWAHPKSQFQFGSRFLHDLKIMGFDVVPDKEELKHFDTAMAHVSRDVNLEISAISRVLGVKGYKLPSSKEEEIINGEGLDSLRYAQEHSRWDDWAKRAARLRILGKDIEISSEHWSRLIEEFKDFRGEPNEITFFLSNLSILSADEVRVPKGGGLELIRHKSFGPQTPQMPESRNF